MTFAMPLLAITGLLGAVSAQAPDRPLVIPHDDAAIVWSACPAVFPEGCELTVLHGDPSAPGADLLLRVAPGQALPWHSHTSAERMMLAAGRLTVKYSGAEEATVTPGAYAFGPAAVPHRATCVSDEACVLYIAFNGPVDAMLAEGDGE
jgi:quercetin dioxygenase-like cupin family protein